MGFFKKLIWRFSKTGFRDTMLWLWGHAKTNYRERTRKIDTSGKLPDDAEAVDGCNGYEPIEYECLDALFRYIQPNQNHVIVDYGSGKGRVVIDAATYPFKRVEGVEFEPRLVKDCEQNIGRFKPDWLGSKVLLHCCDAREYEIPIDATHLFLWNSFIDEVLRDVLELIRQFAEEVDHPVNVFMALPSDELDSLRLFGAFEEVSEIRFRYWTGVKMYHFVPRIGRELPVQARLNSLPTT